jgi:apolipoprotein D and lipocalin family protein
MGKTINLWALLGLVMLLSGCGATLPPLKTVDHVDIPRFMGDWYVIAVIPTFIEKGAHNAVESYRLDPDGTIATTFTFRKGAFDGPLKTYKPRGFIVDSTTNATWGMQFIWPIKAEYLITHLNEDYTQTVIGRNKRDYVWIMARTPQIPEADYLQLVKELEDQGYDISRLRKTPQRWPNDGKRP